MSKLQSWNKRGTPKIDPTRYFGHVLKRCIQNKSAIKCGHISLRFVFIFGSKSASFWEIIYEGQQKKIISCILKQGSFLGKHEENSVSVSMDLFGPFIIYNV